jgi:formamidopyrimidine-DNA glycosylase
MPELPEVETVRRGLAKLIRGRKILNVKILNAKSFQNFAGEFLPADSRAVCKHLIGAEIRDIRRRGKLLIIDLSGDFSLAIHLKMTGQIVVRESGENWGAGHPTDSFVAKLPDKSTRVWFDLSDGAQLFFNDQRKFGWIKLLPTREIENLNFVAKLGPEIANFAKNNDNKINESTFAEFIKRARKHANSSIKSVILDQEVVAGIGNIYADESLWGAKIHPAEKVKNLSDFELREILSQAKIAMEKSLAVGGSTMQNYVRADGTRGNYLDKFANVFRREGQPCPRCGAEIIKIKVAGRGTHLCPKCQKETV